MVLWKFMGFEYGILLGPYYLGIIRACQTILNVFNILFQTIENIFPTIISKN